MRSAGVRRMVQGGRSVPAWRGRSDVGETCPRITKVKGKVDGKPQFGHILQLMRDLYTRELGPGVSGSLLLVRSWLGVCAIGIVHQQFYKRGESKGPLRGIVELSY